MNQSQLTRTARVVVENWMTLNSSPSFGGVSSSVRSFPAGGRFLAAMAELHAMVGCQSCDPAPTGIQQAMPQMGPLDQAMPQGPHVAQDTPKAEMSPPRTRLGVVGWLRERLGGLGITPAAWAAVLPLIVLDVIEGKEPGTILGDVMVALGLSFPPMM